NDPPVIEAPSSIVLQPGDELFYEAIVYDPDCDGSELQITFEGLPSWCIVSGDSISGTAECDYTDTTFTVIVSDGDLADSALVLIEIDHSNQSPTVTDTLTLVYVRNGRPFSYYPAIQDPDDSVHTIEYIKYPYWCTIISDTLIGIAPQESSSESVQVNVHDYCNSDSYGFDVIVYLCGDTNADGNVNVSDGVAVINFVFVGGQPPAPLESADTNCDSHINVSDAIYIINFVFVGGAEPCHDCP
ncbi:MAG: hypothetical protein GWN61_00270, partial [candidate division Zixibacteria bacterium]|nr:hypothetical protein [candidate division Zixibacteria bacterium]NIR62244.1 hypothetical protein [candidate division Zixibacteria bacterium]NIS14795.1 hypothetical protein [candidate division Zixibacteria bacterium]NIS44479.1 hypothetical protein [candidate division Zixibacteria bacterium]NIU12494.1 hypothetical protein [candidate division Zixibacteria bacterium]